MSRSRSRRLSRTLAALSFACAALQPIAATEYAITTTADDLAVNGNCTLREALWAAMANAAVDACPAGSTAAPDTIALGAGTYFLPVGVLEGAGAGETRIVGPAGDWPSAVISGNSTDRIFDLDSGTGTLTLEDLELRDGRAPASSPAMGAAVRVLAGSLTARRVQFFGNIAAFGGAIGFGPSGAGRSLVLEGCGFEANRAQGSPGANLTRGGALYAEVNPGVELHVSDSQFVGNRAESAEDFASPAGGAVALEVAAASSVTTFERIKFEGNVAATTGAFSSPGAGALYATFNDGSFRMSDIAMAGNRLEGPASALPVAMSLSLADATQATIERFHLVGGDSFRAQFQAFVSVAGSANLRMQSILLDAAATQNGLSIFSGESASVDLDQFTVVGHVHAGLNGMQSGSGVLVLRNSILYGNGTNLEFEGATDSRPENLIGIDPLFTDAAGGDYRLEESSPAVNAGDTDAPFLGLYDLAHGARVVGSETDLGAYERGALFSDGFEAGTTASWGW